MHITAPRTRLLIVALVITAAGGILRPPGAFAADLTAATVRAFNRYVNVTEALRNQQRSRPGDFFYFQTLPAAQQRPILTAIKGGEVPVMQLETRSASGKSLPLPDGMINHWEGVMFIPRATLHNVIEVLQDYSRYSDIYKPEMVRSRLLSRQDDGFHVYVRVVKSSPWVTPVFNINLEIHYTLLDASRALVDTHSTRIAQVEDAGQPGEHEDSVGHDGGYMWRFNSYWRLEERDGGVMAEWESLVLSRQIPFLLRWFVRPFVNRLARQTVSDLMEATRATVEKRRAAPAP
jgi:hypothetical protein